MWRQLPRKKKKKKTELGINIMAPLFDWQDQFKLGPKHNPKV